MMWLSKVTAKRGNLERGWAWLMDSVKSTAPIKASFGDL